MSLLDLTLRNVRRNFRLYTIYLFSMITGVVIYFTFLSLMFNRDVLDALRNRQNFEAGVATATTVIILFIVVFVLYANSFFMRQRKKELGMYLLYGMTEGQITRMVFYETLAIGVFSLVTGILLGGLLSKLFGRLLMNLMRYHQVISLSFPLQAVGATVVIFLLLACVISIQTHVMIRRVQLVELFHAKEKTEKPVKPSRWLALLSVTLLGAAYALLAAGRESAAWREHMGASLIVCTVGIILGTYLLFRQFAGWLLERLRRRRRYHVGNTVLWSSAIRFQIRSNTLNLTFISLFSTVILLLVSFVAVNYAVQFEAVGRNLPNDIAYEAQDASMQERLDRMIADSGHAVLDHRILETLQVEAKSTLGTAFENPEYFNPAMLLLVPQSAYNGMMELREEPEHRVRLADGEALSLSQGMDLGSITYPAGQEPRFSIAAGGTALEELKLMEKKDYALLGWASDPVRSMLKKPAVLVISDGTYAKLKPSAPVKRFELYKIAGAGRAEELSKELHELVTATPGSYYSSFADVYSKQIEGSSLLLFSGAFLALIALFALASVIYFKQLREAEDAKQQYAILRKLGVEPSEMKSVIRKQLLFVFSLPLLLGTANSGLIFKTYILDTIQDFPDLTGIFWGVMGLYGLIYLFFYLSSAGIYYRIVQVK
ncbi:ABC transporter permease [Gorillibacterium sp. sgz5001074]|uniref:ABC transporter permease n=1 Tax=Gorillibacterium sp. sgz5001074 TaxID=3446695 RepID=UPI003F66F4DB